MWVEAPWSLTASSVPVLQEGQIGWNLCGWSVTGVSRDFPRGYLCSNRRLALPTGAVRSLTCWWKEGSTSKQAVVFCRSSQVPLSVCWPCSKAEAIRLLLSALPGLRHLKFHWGNRYLSEVSKVDGWDSSLNTWDFAVNDCKKKKPKISVSKDGDYWKLK